MTEQRYLEDSTVREFEATVERTVSDDRVVLDRTHFYPEGGGQPNDTGTLTADGDEWRVVDVQKHDGIHHYLEPTEGTEADFPDAGSTVTGTLDWDRRYSHMRYHTAQHLLSALLLNEYDAETTGNQVRANRASLDCAYERFHTDELEHIETRLNELVDEARPVEWYVLDRETAEETLDPERTRLSLLPDSITEIRIVEIAGRSASRAAAEAGRSASRTAAEAGRSASRTAAEAGRSASRTAAEGGGVDEDDEPFDRTACAGTHVSNTEEIGEVTVTGRETKGSQEERIRFELA